jgi:hypothetical protein
MKTSSAPYRARRCCSTAPVFRGPRQSVAMGSPWGRLVHPSSRREPAWPPVARQRAGPRHGLADPREVAVRLECSAALRGLPAGTPEYDRARLSAIEALRARRNQPDGYCRTSDLPTTRLRRTATPAERSTLPVRVNTDSAGQSSRARSAPWMAPRGQSRLTASDLWPTGRPGWGPRESCKPVAWGPLGTGCR